MKAYQPFAIIEDALGYQGSRYSFKVYPSERAAWDAMPEFLARLERRDDYDLGYAEKVLETSVVELILTEAEKDG